MPPWLPRMPVLLTGLLLAAPALPDAVARDS